MRHPQGNAKGRGRLLVGGLLLLGAVNLGVSGFLAWRGETLERSLHDSESARAEALTALAAVHSTAERQRRDVDEELATLRLRHQETVATLERRLEEHAQRTAARSEHVATELVDALAHEQEGRRAEQVIALRREIDSLEHTIDRHLLRLDARLEPEAERFRRISRSADPSVFLIHCQFDYLVKAREADAEGELHSGTGWGTGFVIAEGGLLVTNKHVVQPWKFDPELATMVALDEAEILMDSVRISAWPAGTRCMTEDREPDYSTGYNNHRLENLRLLRTAEDHWVEKNSSFRFQELSYRIHALDDADVALLGISGETEHPPLVCARPGEVGVRPLDRVMALGYPRGQRGLEGLVAVSSPTVGAVRKVENTIQITASIIPGNSGGPLFDAEGRVVGIATRIYSETLGICLRIDRALDLLAAHRAAASATDPN